MRSDWEKQRIKVHIVVIIISINFVCVNNLLVLYVIILLILLFLLFLLYIILLLLLFLLFLLLLLLLLLLCAGCEEKKSTLCSMKHAR